MITTIATVKRRIHPQVQHNTSVKLYTYIASIDATFLIEPKSLIFIHATVQSAIKSFPLIDLTTFTADLLPVTVPSLLIGASVSEHPSSDANGTCFYIYYVSYIVPHMLNLSNLTHVTSMKYY